MKIEPIISYTEEISIKSDAKKMKGYQILQTYYNTKKVSRYTSPITGQCKLLCRAYLKEICGLGQKQ